RLIGLQLPHVPVHSGCTGRAGDRSLAIPILRSSSVRDTQTMQVGVVLERRRIGNPWQEYAWRPVAVIPGAPEVTRPRLLMREGPIELYHAATLPIELFRSETEGYRYNLSQEQPRVYVVLRFSESDGEPRPFLVTMCPYEAQDYSESGSDIVDGVLAPDAVLAWV